VTPVQQHAGHVVPVQPGHPTSFPQWQKRKKEKDNRQMSKPGGRLKLLELRNYKLEFININNNMAQCTVCNVPENVTGRFLLFLFFTLLFIQHA
jgi:hypothetical protein